MAITEDAPTRDRPVYKLNSDFRSHIGKRSLLTRDKEICVELAGDATANVICVFLESVEFSGIWDVPKSTSVIVWCCQDVIAAWGEVCYMNGSEKKNRGKKQQRLKQARQAYKNTLKSVADVVFWGRQNLELIIISVDGSLKESSRDHYTPVQQWTHFQHSRVYFSHIFQVSR